MNIDPKLYDYATPTQKITLDALKECDSFNAADRKLGRAHDKSRDSFRRLERHAAKLGYAPGNWTGGTAPGYHLGKVTVHRDGKGEVVQTWERQHPDDARRMMELIAAALAEDIPRASPLPTPEFTSRKLLNLYTLTDCHVGMLAWGKESGEPWDLKIAEKTIFGCFEKMIASAPPAHYCIVNQLGDFLHSDSMLPMTPTSHNILDQDVRFAKMVRTAITLLRRVVDLALQKHNEVIVVMAEGNHDMASSVWLRLMFEALYENEPRVHVIDSELPYYAYQHGKTMLAFHHGHLKKPDEFPLVFAAQYGEMWGQTTKRYAHSGHQHHLYSKEHGGMIVTQHPTLAARDAYAARGGWFAERAATAITYHEDYGQVASVTIVPEMLEDSE